ncbi:MAG: ABC transporter permease [Proteobacteria bacterium]|nr:ABC transporter permease [Pseudomonadota bacterium]
MKSGLHVWIAMFEELVEYRGLIWRLLVRDISARYRQSVLGILWAFFTPLVAVIVFVWAKNNNMLPIGITAMPYPAYVFLGQMIWLLFSQGITSTANSLVGSSALLTKINFPKEVLLLAALGQTIFDFLIRIPLLILIFVWTGFLPHLNILMVPFALVPLLFLTLGIGFFASLFNAILRDISNGLSLLLIVGMLVTPVVYPPPTTWPLSFWINQINPVSGYLIAIQDLISTGTLSNPSAYISAVLLSMIIFFTGWRLFHLVEPKIAERI